MITVTATISESLIREVERREQELGGCGERY
jgi:hypothetical protein